jgi:two-component system, sensor histidine kinase YesM
VKFGNSLRKQLVFSAAIGLAIVILSVAYILFATVRLQQIINNQFSTERFFQRLQNEVIAIEEPLLNYLSSRSSQALAQILIEEQTLRNMLPPDRPLSNDPFTVESREIYFLIDRYLDLMQETLELKRARAIEGYTTRYEELVELNNHIVNRIDRISLFGLRRELDNYQEIINASRTMLFWNLLVIISAFLSSTMWFAVTIGRFTEPMDLLARSAGEISSGNFDIEDISVHTVHELNVVVNAFNTMKHDIRQYIAEINHQKEIEQGYMEERVRNLKMEELLKRMELYTMQAQMSPHFLFNTLNTGVQLAIMEEADKTADFMEHLADFFRHNIRERDLIVPLRQEIDGLEAYLYILRIRFPRSLQLTMDVPEELLDTCNVPALILQPLVENSVLHAFRGKDRMGAITIRVRKEESRIILSVTDNGIGIDRDTAERLLRRYSRDAEHNSKIMGLENVIQRLYFFYPSQDDVVAIYTTPGEGTEIVITLDTRIAPCIPS